MKSLLPWIAVPLSAFAAVVSFIALDRPTKEALAMQMVDMGPLADRIDALEQDAASVRQLVDADRLTAPPAAAREVTKAVPDARIDELIARLDRMEKQFEGVLTAASARSRVDELMRQRSEARARPMSEVTSQARNAAATEAQRLEALSILRGQQLEDGTDARLPVLDDMIRLAQTSTDGATRADVWRQLSHVTDARLKHPLMQALTSDTDPKAREEAAETLADFLPDAQVEAALRAAMQNDAVQKVRKQAAESLAGG